MNPVLSIYLDFVRLGSAMVVAFSHICPVLFPNIILPFPGGHAVVVFFVISGFVIAYSVDKKDRMFNIYLVNRLSRLWCVVVPALILGVLIIPIVGRTQVAEAAPPPADWSSAGIHSILNLFFFSQFWALKEPPPFNTPFWSLSYEAAYYTMFAAWVFPGRRWRVGLSLVSAALAGPKILLLMPCWLLGVWLYWHPRVQNLKPMVATAIFVVSVVIYLAVFWIDLPVVLTRKMDVLWPWQMGQIGASRTFVGDYIIAVLVTANFASISRVPGLGNLLIKMRRPVTLAASFTLSIYLYHVPLLALLHGGFRCPALITLLMITVGIIVLGFLTEHKRTALRRLMTIGLTGEPPQKNSEREMRLSYR